MNPPNEQTRLIEMERDRIIAALAAAKVPTHAKGLSPYGFDWIAGHRNEILDMAIAIVEGDTKC